MGAVIDRNEQLAEFLLQVQGAPWVALDTEADSLHWYPERLCLLQVSIPGADRIVDPLASLDLAPFWAALQDRELILHGADYDLRLLWRGPRFAPAAVFDTMLAARLLGYKQFGLVDLVSRHCKCHLEKGNRLC